ncbi:MAG: helix-turn-helix domain-containing protein [Brachybacterium tyrofermentans]|uniref:helix-turn-helix domain-containing protein n=1 Tax=Brachybacterium tyrofermentans TaxID=47848 RepID=UPI003FB7437A
MTSFVGDIILVLRRAAGLTQGELAERMGESTQAALSRYENCMRVPDSDALDRLAHALGVTVGFLEHEFKMRGAIAADAHMRRQKSTKPTDWKRVEARLNVLRMHSSYLLERMPLASENHVLAIDPVDRTPSEAAEIIRASWKMPIGPVRSLYRWVEAAGVLIIEEDLGTRRIDGMSQWAGDHAVILVNSVLPTDRKRLTVAHELGHLVLHTGDLDEDIEGQANEFAAAFLMPEHVISSQLRNLSMGQLGHLKTEWGVSMQAIFERAYRLNKASAAERTRFYRQMSSRGWRTREPHSDSLPAEAPQLATSLGDSLQQAGLSQTEIRELIGIQPGMSSPFVRPGRHLQAV